MALRGSMISLFSVSRNFYGLRLLLLEKVLRQELVWSYATSTTNSFCLVEVGLMLSASMICTLSIQSRRRGSIATTSETQRLTKTLKLEQDIQ